MRRRCFHICSTDFSLWTFSRSFSAEAISVLLHGDVRHVLIQCQTPSKTQMDKETRLFVPLSDHPLSVRGVHPMGERGADASQKCKNPESNKYTKFGQLSGKKSLK